MNFFLNTFTQRLYMSLLSAQNSLARGDHMGTLPECVAGEV